MANQDPHIHDWQILHKATSFLECEYIDVVFYCSECLDSTKRRIPLYTDLVESEKKG